jgi:hypothetical protein
MFISQIRRYESGQPQQALDEIRKLAVALGGNADTPLFEKEERGPVDRLKLQFEDVSQLDPEEQKLARSVIESIIPRNAMKEAARRFSAADSGGSR